MPLTCCFMEKRILDSFDKCFTNKMLASEDQLRGSGVVGKKRQSRLESNDISWYLQYIYIIMIIIYVYANFNQFRFTNLCWQWLRFLLSRKIFLQTWGHLRWKTPASFFSSKGFHRLWFCTGSFHPKPKVSALWQAWIALKLIMIWDMKTWYLYGWRAYVGFCTVDCSDCSSTFRNRRVRKSSWRGEIAFEGGNAELITADIHWYLLILDDTLISLVNCLSQDPEWAISVGSKFLRSREHKFGPLGMFVSARLQQMSVQKGTWQ